jgi:outer membrane lipoprotein-sorting protein
MRRTIGFAAIAALVAVAVAQTTGTNLLSGFGKALNDAKTVQSNFTVQTIGGSPDEYNIALKKPNMVRVDTPTMLFVSDGKTLTTLTKADNTYFKKPMTDGDIKEMFSSDELRLFAGFFNVAAYNGPHTKLLGQRQVNGTPLQVIEASAPHRVDTYFLAQDQVARKRQTDLTGPTGTTTSIVNAKSVDLNSEIKDTVFQFVAPNGARELSMDEINSGRWYTDLDQALKIARASNKRVFIDFMATWCGPCKELAKTCFDTPEFKALGKSYVFCRIDVDDQPSLAQKYGAEAIPLQVITDTNGTVVESLTGWGGADRFFGFLKRNAK